MLGRRNFLGLLGLSPIAAPAAVNAVANDALYGGYKLTGAPAIGIATLAEGHDPIDTPARKMARKFWHKIDRENDRHAHRRSTINQGQPRPGIDAMKSWSPAFKRQAEADAFENDQRLHDARRAALAEKMAAYLDANGLPGSMLADFAYWLDDYGVDHPF